VGFRAGIAVIDITPEYPVRLAGFGSRRAESDGVTQRIHAKALALDDGEPALLVTADLCGIPSKITDELAKRLQPLGIRRERIALTVTHTHTAPMVTGYLPTLFGVAIPREHQQRIDRYTGELLDKLEQVAKAALADRQPARLSWGVGSVGFAKNRRPAGGPVDHDLPVLAIHDPEGKLRAVYASYACHCVTLTNNKLSGDWAGFAQQVVESDFAGAVALISIGCGADQNPDRSATGDNVELATVEGRQITAEVKRLVGGFLAPVNGPLRAQIRRLELPLIEPPTRAVWEERVKKNGADSKSYAIGYHAVVQLAKLNRGERLPTKVDYAVQTWVFGDDLAMAFLPGEVVVDYGLRLKRELDIRRLWINSYSNDVPCYIPSERVLKEGGYEGGGAMVYYDLPGPFKPGLEQPIVDAVRELVGERYKAPFDGNKTGGTRPLSPQQSQAVIKTRPGLVTELVVAEPLVVDPVAIDFGPDGAMWVAEMHDYPSGGDGKLRPAGRIRRLTSSRGDGRYDSATVFLDNIQFPTGVTVWRKGVLVCAAPDILYAVDTDGDGKADEVRKLYTGFGTDNYQARVNSLEYGLDGWVYGSCGLFGGTITSFSGAKLALGNRDFRIKPDTGEIEPATGRTQQGRVRDDWGNWFGCDNSTLAWHYPLADHDLRRNPHVTLPNPAVVVTQGRAGDRLFPVSQSLQLFKQSGPPGLPTAACGLGVYRDELLGHDFTGDLVTCEPVNLLVTRRKLELQGSTFVGRRVASERESELLASTDTWFRPVQARTGPDGCLYVVDMYRYVIEHPRWIPVEELAKVDVRAGSTMGRIYRVRPEDGLPRPVPRLDRLDTKGLVEALDSPNGWQRDLATQMLKWRNDLAAISPLVSLAKTHPRPQTRLHVLSALAGLGNLEPGLLTRALHDEHPGVRSLAVDFIGQMVTTMPELGARLAECVNDTSPQVRLRLACALGAWRDPRAGAALIPLTVRAPDDPYLSAAVLSSLNSDNIASAIQALGADLASPPVRVVEGLLVTAIALDSRDAVASLLRAVATQSDGRVATWRMAATASTLDALDRRKLSFADWCGPNVTVSIRTLIDRARALAIDENALSDDRATAAGLLGRDSASRNLDNIALEKLLEPRHAAIVQAAAAVALSRNSAESNADLLIGAWSSASPTLRSQILELLVSRAAWHNRLFKAIEADEIPAGQIDLPRRQRLLTHADAAVRKRAEALLAGSTRPDREKLLEEYQDVLKLAGDRGRGRTTFGKHCAVCHQLDGVGHAVGPDLAAVSNKSPGFLLQEILDPNRNVDSRYLEYHATTLDGRSFSGVLVAETATGLTLKAQEGREQVILRKDLERLQGTGKSLMPEGLEKLLTRQDLADVIAYLISSGARSAISP
jgi:putative membrane-bound dehydrogenase-like protein